MELGGFVLVVDYFISVVTVFHVKEGTLFEGAGGSRGLEEVAY
jgi:hypothetical protein